MATTEDDAVKAREKAQLKRRKKRKYVLLELLQTETKFRDHMKEIVEVYMEPLEAAVADPKQRYILRTEYIKTTFSVVRQILDLAHAFVEDLEKVCAVCGVPSFHMCVPTTQHRRVVCKHKHRLTATTRISLWGR